MRHSSFGRVFIVALSCSLLSLSACTELVERSQVAVSIDADPSLRARIAHVDVEALSGNSDPSATQQLAASSARWQTRFTQRLTPAGADSGWPLGLLLVRHSGEALNYLVVATALDAHDTPIGQVQMRSAYAPGKTIQLRLHFDTKCVEREQPCSDTQTCSDGQCVDAFVDPRSLPPPDNSQPGVTEVTPTAGVSGGGAAGQAGAQPKSCDAGGECPAASSCGTNNGGCDRLVSCVEMGGQPECSVCPSGYLGDGRSGCLPALSGLEALNGRLQPTFNREQTDYTLELPLAADRALLKPTAAAGIALSIDGVAVASDTSSSSSAPGLNEERSLTIAVSAPDHPTRSYTIKVHRAGKAAGYLKAGNAGTKDEFGRSIALSGDTLLVGAPYEDANASSTAGASNDALMDSGAAYVFVRDAAGGWQQQAYLKADPPKAGALFGYAVAIERDRAVISAQSESDVGAAYVFERADGVWTQSEVLRPDNMGGSGAEFGAAVALLGDRIAIGVAGDDMGGTDSGAVYVFERAGADWPLAARIKSKTPEVYGWLGSSVALAGDLLFSGATGDNVEDLPCGAVHIFAAKGGKWEETDKLTPSPVAAGGFFGEGLAVSGDFVAASAFNGTVGLTDGVVFMYVREASGKYRQETVLRADNPTGADFFGARVALSGNTLLVGAAQEGSAGGGINAELGGKVENSGAAFLFNHDAGAWRPIARIKAAQPFAQDLFGTSVAVSEDLLAIGANGDASSGSGIDPQPTPKDAAKSGAVHLFR